MSQIAVVKVKETKFPFFGNEVENLADRIRHVRIKCSCDVGKHKDHPRRTGWRLNAS